MTIPIPAFISMTLIKVRINISKTLLFLINHCFQIRNLCSIFFPIKIKTTSGKISVKLAVNAKKARLMKNSA